MGAALARARVEPLLDLRSPAIDPPAWVRALEGFAPLDPAARERWPAEERAGEGARAFEQGWRARVPVIETPLYLPWLLEGVRARGGALEQREIQSLDDARGFDALVNCTGLGSRELFGDRECFPIRGQIVRVPRGAVDRALVFQREDGRFGYVVPRSADCVLGGTAERGTT